jgi:hypothetical protein
MKNFVRHSNLPQILHKELKTPPLVVQYALSSFNKTVVCLGTKYYVQFRYISKLGRNKTVGVETKDAIKSTGSYENSEYHRNLAKGRNLNLLEIFMT